MTRTDAPRYACACTSPEYHQTGNPRCMVSILLAALQDQGAALLPADPSAAVSPEPLPTVGDTVKYEFYGAIWTDEVVAVDGDYFRVKGNGRALHRSVLVIAK